MATDFGEILEPSSRAFWDGFDELEENLGPPIKLEWQWMTETSQPANIDNLDLMLIIEGSEILDFVKTVLLKDLQILCKLENAKVTVYHCAQSKTLYCVSEENSLHYASTITELISPWLKVAKNAVTFTVLPKTSYKGDDVNDFQGIAFIRGINSSYEYAKELEPPNFITGVSAGAASWRYLHNQQISSYVVYIDSEKLDVLSTKPILDLFKDIGLKCDEKYIPKLKDDSHLYM